MGTPAYCRARRSRWMVRTVTSNRSARRWALRARGALARSSSTRAYRRSVRFIVAARYREDVTAATGVRGRRSQRLCRPGCGHTHGPIGSDHGWRSVAIDLATSPDSCSRSRRLDDPAATCDGPSRWFHNVRDGLGCCAAMTTPTMAEQLVPDDLWAAIQPLLPPKPPHLKGGRPWIQDRAVLGGITYVLRAGVPWRRLPAQELGGGGCATGRPPASGRACITGCWTGWATTAR